MKSVASEWEMRCPKCRSDESIDIAATVWVRLGPYGTDADESANGDKEWDNDSLAVCNCGYAGRVKDFSIEPEDVEEEDEE